MSSVSSSSALVWIKVIQWCGKKEQVVLTLPGKELDWSSNNSQKVFTCMGQGSLVCKTSNLEFPLEFRQLKDQCFGFLGHRSSEVWNGINNAADVIFERLGWFNWCGNRHIGGSVSRDSRRIRNSGFWV